MTQTDRATDHGSQLKPRQTCAPPSVSYSITNVMRSMLLLSKPYLPNRLHSVMMVIVDVVTTVVEALFYMYIWTVFKITEYIKRLWQRIYKHFKLHEHSFSPYHLGAATPETEVTLHLHIRMWWLYTSLLVGKIIQNRISSICRWCTLAWQHIPICNALWPCPPYPGTRNVSKKWIEMIMKKRGLIDNWSRISNIRIEELQSSEDHVCSTFLDGQHMRMYRLYIDYHESNPNPINTLIMRASKTRTVYSVRARDYIGSAPGTETLFLRNQLSKDYDGANFTRQKFLTGAGFLNGVLWTFYWPWGDYITIAQDVEQSDHIVPYHSVDRHTGLCSLLISLARLHSTLWNKLGEYEWLGDSDVYDGSGDTRWESLIAHVRRQWSNSRAVRKRLVDDKGKRLIPPRLEAFVDESLSLSHYNYLTDFLASRPVCLRISYITYQNVSLVEIDEKDRDIGRPKTSGANTDKIINAALKNHHCRYRARLDDWRKTGLGPPSHDIAAAMLLTQDPTSWYEELMSDEYLGCYYNTLKDCLGVQQLTDINGNEYTMEHLRSDTISGGMEHLILELIRECSRVSNRRCDTHKIASYVRRTMIWYDAFLKDTDYILITKGS